MNKHDKGFSLLEIMVVVALIGIMLCIAIPNLAYAHTTSQANTCISNLRQIDSACQQIAIANNLPPGSTLSLTNDLGAYLKSIPHCPAGGTYTVLPVGSNPQVCCSLNAEPHNHVLY